MNNIVERLRKEADLWAGGTHTVSGPRLADLLREAANEIEQLREVGIKVSVNE